MTTFEIVGSLMILSGISIAYAMYVAPEMDDKGRITKPGKKLRDLFRKSPHDDFYS
jgi:hypothetical protein